MRVGPCTSCMAKPPSVAFTLASHTGPYRTYVEKVDWVTGVRVPSVRPVMSYTHTHTHTRAGRCIHMYVGFLGLR